MPLIHAMLSNAAVAAVLAVLALAVGPICRSPAVRHLLWVLVLLKLVTPPLFPVPVAVLPASWVSGDKATRPQGDRVTDSAHYLSSTEQIALTETHSLPTPQPVAVSPLHHVSWADGALALWIAGATGWFLGQGRRILRFRRWTTRAEDVGPEVAVAVRQIAQALGIRRPPAVKTAAGIGSPMLWGLGRGTVVLFPRELLARLSPEARDTLLAHELAHYLRRDHWVRVLEFVAAGLYWWHPAVWLAHVGIEAAEEECCDAWVVGGLSASPRRYAEAMLATIDLAAELRRPCLPPGACPANRDARLLQRRLIGIIHAERPGQLPGAAAIRTAVAAVLLIQPVLRAAPYSVPTPESQGALGSQESEVRSQRSEVRGQGSEVRTRKPAGPRAWAVAPSPDGAITAVARDNEVVLRRKDGTATPLGPGKPVALAFAPNAARLATAGPGPLVRTWDYEGNRIAEVRVSAAARSIVFTPDGERLLVLDAAGVISVHDPNSLALVAGWSVEGPANSIACGPDNQTVAVSFGSWLDAETGWVECWSIRQRRKLSSYSASAPVGAARIEPDGRFLIAGGWNGLLTWRTLPEGELIAERRMPKNVVAAAAFSPDAGTLPLDPPPEPEPLPPPQLMTMPEPLQGISSLRAP